MKRKIFAMLLICIAIAAFADENGYKEFTWGMTIEQVKEKAADLTETQFNSWTAPKSILVLLNLDKRITDEWGYTSGAGFPDPLAQTQDVITKYYSESVQATFYFANEKLVATDLFFGWQDDGGIDKALADIYGASTVGLEIISPMFYGKLWIEDSILWNVNNAGPEETVTYYDAAWLTPLLERAKLLIPEPPRSTRSRL
jgi:hypothetical protein